MPFEVGVFVAGAIVFALGMIGLMRWRERQRTQSLRHVAEEMGLEFRPEGDAALQKRLAHFQLFNQGRRRKLRNLVVGDAGDINISIFDYQYTVGGGNHQATIRQTVAMLAAESLELPPLVLRPESMFDKLGTALGLQQDINFPDYPLFSRLYLLKSPDPDRVRRLFHSALIELLQKKKRTCIEAVPGLVIIYNARRQRKPVGLKQFFAEALELYNHLIRELSGPENPSGSPVSTRK